MTDILCNWLNNDMKLSKALDDKNFAKELSSGYLIGELLQKHDLINDFDQFSQNVTEDSKLNNFMRIEPVLALLEIPFDTNIARQVMTEQAGVVTRLMYQLFIALNKKEKNNLTGAAMETMRPAAPVKLEQVESILYKRKLKKVTPRQTDKNLMGISAKYHEKKLASDGKNFREAYDEQKRHEELVQIKRQEELDLQKNRIDKRTEMLAKIHAEDVYPCNSNLSESSKNDRDSDNSRAAIVKIPKPPPSQTVEAIAQRKKLKKLQEAEDMKHDIDVFETKLARQLPISAEIQEINLDSKGDQDLIGLIKPRSNDAYINKIKKRLNEDHFAREEREKRRRKILVDQMKAHEAQEESRREEQLVARLLKQSQQEKRIATQLLQVRKEKDNLRRNRIEREEQYAEMRAREFREALEREAEMARLAKLEFQDEAEKEYELHRQLMAERRQEEYDRHYASCRQDVLDMLDFTTKVAEYRELTQKLIPQKIIRDWLSLFVHSKPLYEIPSIDTLLDSEVPSGEELLELERQELLDDGDFEEYRNMVGEWQPPENSTVQGLPANNPILGHIVQRLFDLSYPPSPPPEAPKFPDFPIKASVIGKPFAGKTTILKMVSQTHKLKVLQIDELIEEAINAYKESEVEEVIRPPPTPKKISTPVQEKQDTEQQEKIENLEEKPKEEVDKLETKAETTIDNKEELVKGENVEKQDEKKEGEQESPKPIEIEEDEEPVEPIYQPTARAELGKLALNLLKKGKTITDELMVEIFADAIRRLEDGTGWVLDGFPTNFNQAKLLEKALTGQDPVVEKKQKKKKSELVADPRPPPPAPEMKSFLDVVVYFNITDELCMMRSIGRKKKLQDNDGIEFHPVFNEPPEGSATGIKGQEQLADVKDFSHDQEQLQTRLTKFNEYFSPLKSFYEKYCRLENVQVDQETDAVALELEHVFEDSLDRIFKRGKYEVIPEPEPIVEEKPPEPEPKPPTPPPPEPVVQEVEKGKKKGKKSTSPSPKRGSSPKKDDTSSGKKSRESSAGKKSKSPKRPKSGKKGKGKDVEEPQVDETPPGPPPIQPGSDEWKFVDLPIIDELAVAISSKWESIENVYAKHHKNVFRKTRFEREGIIKYLYDIRQEFLAYLRRPDQKNDRISLWQKEFNMIPDDLRDDEEQRAELHERVDDLREILWEMSDERKTAAEKEIELITKDGWLDDKIGLLINHYLSSIQVETDRFQDTSKLLRDYYRSMEGKMPDESSKNFYRLPLVELEAELDDETKSRSGNIESRNLSLDTSNEPATVTPVPTSRQASAKSRQSSSPKGRKNKKSKVVDKEEAAIIAQDLGDKSKPIPLVPRRAGSPDMGKKKEGAAKQRKDVEELPPPPDDNDERLLYDGLHNALQSVDRMTGADKAAWEAEELAERELKMMKEKEAAEKEKAASKGKDKKDKKDKKAKSPSRTPSGKKGKKDKKAEPVVEPAQELTEEERLAKEIKDNTKIEYYAAIQNEADAVKKRIQLIKDVAWKIIVDLRLKADQAYKDMNDWLGSRFLKEMESIDYLTEVMRHAIEGGNKIKEQLVIDQDEFLISEITLKELGDNTKVDPKLYIDADTKLVRTPSPIPKPETRELTYPDIYTVEQLKTIQDQLSQMSPNALISIQAFIQRLNNLISLSQGSEQLPDVWLQASPSQIELLANCLSPDGEYVDCRLFMLHISQPWPLPNQNILLEALDEFKKMDQTNSGYVTKEQYDAMDLWFKKSEEVCNDDEFDRKSNLATAFFNIFADFERKPIGLNYVDMLLYFCVHPDANEGFLRALSITNGSHMPRFEATKLPVHTHALSRTRDIILTTPRPIWPNGTASVGSRRDSTMSVFLPMAAISSSASSRNVTSTYSPNKKSKKRDKKTKGDEKVKSMEQSKLLMKNAEEKLLQASSPVAQRRLTSFKELPFGPANEIPNEATNVQISIDSLYKVLHHGQSQRGDSHRFSVTTNTEHVFSRDRLAGVWHQIDREENETAQLSIVIEHPVIQEMISMCNTYTLMDLRQILTSQINLEATETNSVKTAE